ncbi:PepSY-associated TM helix domain-containing protein [Pseudothauera rhizosphaerae]|uniref:PepSY domain-containing protein n=1 Tax=Pseudothauera rhizosphaerae TaxID=2565932 RepID=A0A4S4A8M4_9RHOO|nr:PepSY-associated TM helix domain-containing protein [Pseudothauera rhizosphaerae]THF54883.1 PepSY domain-containing protein [Pseudothauera rhizosphaerae]
MRPLLAAAHRWAGLFIAPFLFVAGLTGALISWDHELDEWLNPHLFEARSGAAAAVRTPLELAAGVEAADPRLRVGYLPLSIEPGHTLGMGVAARVDPVTGRRFEPGFNQMAIDPATGAVQGTRQWGAVSLSRENLLPFLYKLHYSLHIPDIGDLKLGMLVMGIVSIVWILDCFVALRLSFPNRRRWRNAFAFRFRQGWPRLNFDLHRSGGVWTWALLLMLAVTSVSMNLGREMMKPVVSLFSPVTPMPWEVRDPAPRDAPIEPAFGRERAIALAAAEARARGWTAPPGAVFYADRFGLYGVGFFAPGREHADGGLGNPWLYIDGRTGELLGEDVPGAGSAGDLFMQAQFPLHSGRILGLPGRILISCMGLAVALLSATGVVIWARRRRA